MKPALRARVQGVLDEPSCTTNQAKPEGERKKGCTKALTPGAAAGGCAFDGAKIALQPIVDAAHLVHGPLACEGNGWDNRGSASSGSELYRSGFTTDLAELDVVMGKGEGKLYRAIREVIEAHRPPAVFVYTTCVSALIGDDVVAVCKAAAERYETPVIPVDAPGFVGSKNLGNKLAGETLLEHVIGTVEPAEPSPLDVNIVGEFNVAGELWQVKPLLDRLGIRILGAISGDARYRQVAMAHRASVTMLVCSKALSNLARGLEDRWGIPWFEGSFYGIADTSDALRKMAAMLIERGAPGDLAERTEALIAEEEARTWAALEPFRERVAGKRVLLYTGGHKTWSVVAALQELGMEVVGTSVRKSTEGDKARIQEIMGDDTHMFENMAPKEMYAVLEGAQADVLMSGGRSRFVALKAKTPWIDVNQEKHEAYAGYVGMVELVRAIDHATNNPMWTDIRAPAPWEQGFAPAPEPSPGLHLTRSDPTDFEDC